MNFKNKLRLLITGLILSALVILQWPHQSLPTASSPPSIMKVDRSRPSVRSSMTKVPLRESRRAKDFQTFVKLAANSELPELSRQEIDDYLAAQLRTAGSLLAAYQLSKDEAYLKEALEKFPNSPQVLLCALQLAKDPAQRLEALEAFKRADPGNGLGNCLAARVLFDLGRNDEAFAELLQSRGKPIQAYTMNTFQDTEEAYLTAGFSSTEAKTAAACTCYATSPELIQLNKFNKNLDALRAGYATAGDAAALQSVRDIQLEIASQLQEDPSIGGNLIGLMNEKNALKGMDDPESIARMEEIERQSKSLVANAMKVSTMIQNSPVPDDEWRLYFDRVKLFGEKSANEWILGKYGLQ